MQYIFQKILGSMVAFLLEYLLQEFIVAQFARRDVLNKIKTAEEAEDAGYRPYLLRRPELAPGLSLTDATSTLARKAARVLKENCGSDQSLEELATRLGCTDRHLRRVFTSEYHVSPVKYLQTCRLLLAKNLLTDTNLSVLDVAMSAGFGSLRRFNDLFKRHYHLSPTEMRKNITNDRKDKSSITLALGYRPPYRWREMINFLGDRAIPGIETIINDEYLRTVHLQDAKQQNFYGWIKVGNDPKKNVLTVTVSESLLSVIPQVLGKVQHMFDLHCDPDLVYSTLRSMNSIRPNLCVSGTRLPGCFDPFEMSVRAVLGQQITVKAARTLASRLIDNYGVTLDTEFSDLTHIFPSPERILSLEGPIESHLGPLGIIPARARTIFELANVHEQRIIDFGFCPDPEIEMEKLLSISGIGKWTAQYIAMRTMKWPDAFLETDVGIKRILSPLTSSDIIKTAEKWQPWRSYATMNLWYSTQNYI